MTYSNEWLIDEIATGRQLEYLYFWGHRPAKDGRTTKSCLSQWFAAGFEHEERRFATAEHWMMWHKALTAGDAASAARIFTTNDPQKAKAIGRQVAGYDDERWAAVKYALVVQGNVLKFQQNPALTKYLLGTGDAVIVEASPYDFQWGIGMRAAEAEALADPTKWRGSNLLGWALMEARDALRG